MKVKIELSEENIRHILADYLNEKYHVDIAAKDLHILVKSKQNYRSEWEKADIKIDQELIPTD